MNLQLIAPLIMNPLMLVFYALAFIVGYKGKSWTWAIGLWALNFILQMLIASPMLVIGGYALLIAFLGWTGIAIIIGSVLWGLGIMLLLWWIGKKLGEK